MNNKSIVKPLIKDTYLAIIKNSIGSKQYQSFFASVNGKKKDIMQKGTLSCAFYVSGVLSMFNLIDRIHGTVDGTVKALKKAGWQELSRPQNGAVLIWESIIDDDGSAHKHIGFSLGKSQAISSSTKKKVIAEHHSTFGTQNGKPKRKIEMILWHPNLN